MIELAKPHACRYLRPSGNAAGGAYSMTLMRALIVGLIGGAIGAAIWAVIAYYTGREIGWIAWIIGAIVGGCTAAGAGEQRGGHTGLLAAVLALLSIAVGKYATVHFIVERESAKILAPQRAKLDRSLTDDEAIVVLANQKVIESQQDGKQLKWPKGVDENAEHESIAEFPTDIAKSAKSNWNAMSDSDKQTFRDEFRRVAVAAFDEHIKTSKPKIEQEIFKQSFGMFDIVFGILAVITAFRLGSGSDNN